MTTTTRRAILAGAAALPTLTATTALNAASSLDPIYAAIERHRAAYKAHDQACTERARLEELLPLVRRQWWPHARDRTAPKGCGDAPEWIAQQLVEDTAGTEECRSLCNLVSTVPTTGGGIAALVRYLIEYVESGSAIDTTFCGEFDANGEPLFLDTNLALLTTIEQAATNLASECRPSEATS